MGYGQDNRGLIICPVRLLERRQIFSDCIHLLLGHQPGNELHIIPEMQIPGGSVDYFLVSVRDGKVRDFVGIELQTLDTTGTVWPMRQRYLRHRGLAVRDEDADSKKSYGMNWKMTAKTILVQLHHKVQTFEHLGKKFVLVLQDHLLNYMQREFSFDHMSEARLADAMHFHAYQMTSDAETLRISLGERLSTDTDGIAKCLGLLADAKVGLGEIVSALELRISEGTLFTMGGSGSLPLGSALADRTEEG